MGRAIESRGVGAGAWALLCSTTTRGNTTGRTLPVCGWQNPQRDHPAGQDERRVHLLAAYLPQEGVVLAQMQVETVGNEVSEAPPLLASLDLRGTVVSGDANFAASALSQAILKAKGDSLWVIKENRSQMYQDIHTLFEPQPSRPG